MPITIAIYGSLVIFMVNISYYNPAYINSLFSPKSTYLFLSALPLSEFDQIITDDGLPESASRALVKQDLSLLVAKNE